MARVLDRLATVVVQLLCVAGLFVLLIFILAQRDRLPHPLIQPDATWRPGDYATLTVDFPGGRFDGNKYVVCSNGRFLFLYSDGTSELWDKPTCWR